MCNPADKPEKYAGVLQIEVTPEMIEKAAAVIMFHCGDDYSTKEWSLQVAEAVLEECLSPGS